MMMMMMTQTLAGKLDRISVDDRATCNSCASEITAVVYHNNDNNNHNNNKHDLYSSAEMSRATTVVPSLSPAVRKWTSPLGGVSQHQMASSAVGVCIDYHKPVGTRPISLCQ